ncbi:MAG: DUF4147 domain-containing protein [Rhodobacteraceae bacterium]|nr:DUF4147 domain-containing protein [Paracoccaceae bacterium]
MPLTRPEMIALFETGVRAADPGAAVAGAVAGVPLEGTVHVLGVGKAAVAMTRAALTALAEAGVTPATALVVTNAENAQPLAGARVMTAGHPVPDAGGLAAGRAVLDMLAGAEAGDTVLVLVSGGGSALLPAPVAGVSLDDKAAVSAVLLGAGLDITAMNAVRQHLSRLKGGGLLRAAAPARVVALILSDVIGDDLRVIASGPTVAPILPRAGVRALLRDRDLWAALPEAARTALERPEDAPPLPEADNRLIGSNRMSLDAMAAARPEAQIICDALTGDVAEAAARICAVAQEAPRGAPVLALFGGETTVTLRGDGRGGRNQELALRVAMALEGALPGGRGWRFLSGGTDGRDGPTDAAGGITDPHTLARLDAAGGDAAALLANNDSYRALALAGDLLKTGGTGTNVADLQILSLDP